MTLALILVLALVAVSVFTLCFTLWQSAVELKSEILILRESVDELRLTSRARVNTVSTSAGEKPQITRVSRFAKGKRVVVGGSENSKQRTLLEESLKEPKSEG
jgi:hypothetical protein